MIILFYLAPSRMLYDKYFLRYDSVKLRIDFFSRFFMILSRIKKRVYSCLFEHANTRKHAYEHSCSSVRAFWRILAHSAHLAQFHLLVACTQLYNPLCPSVGWSVGRLVTLYFIYHFYFFTSFLVILSNFEAF